MNNYESGNVPPAPPHLRDVFNKCTKCGATWIGTPRALCSECAPGVVDDVPPVPESARADMMRQLYGTRAP